jgi:hypothetical protein
LSASTNWKQRLTRNRKAKANTGFAGLMLPLGGAESSATKSGQIWFCWQGSRNGTKSAFQTALMEAAGQQNSVMRRLPMRCNISILFISEKICQGNGRQGNGNKSLLIYSPDNHSSDNGFCPIPLPIIPLPVLPRFGCALQRKAYCSSSLSTVSF